MTLIDLGEFKLRFDPKEIRINIDGETIDIGARMNDPSEFKCDRRDKSLGTIEEASLIRTDFTHRIDTNYTIDCEKNTLKDPTNNEDNKMNLTWNGETKSYSQEDIQDFFDRTSELKQFAKKIREELNDVRGEKKVNP